jgi:hypothetical protein
MLKKSLCPRCRYKIEIESSKEFSRCRFCGLIFITSTILDFENLKSSPQPENGEVIYIKDKDFIYFLIPKRGFNWIDSYTLILMSFMTLFILSISISSLQGFLISIPFLLMLSIVWRDTIFEATKEEKIILESNRLILKEESFILKKSYTIPYDKIRDIIVARIIFKGILLQYKLKMDIPQHHPLIFWSIEDNRFGSYLSLEEMDWLVREIKYNIFKKAL